MNESERERINQFISIVENVKNSRFIKTYKTVSFELNFVTGKPVEQKMTGFDEEDLRSMLIDLRKITLAKDGVRFTEICDLLLSCVSDQAVVGNIQQCKKNYEAIMKKTAIGMIINSVPETGKSIIDKWFYGHYFHEKQYSKDLDKLGAGLYVHKTNFVIAIINLIEVAACVANNAKLIV